MATTTDFDTAVTGLISRYRQLLQERSALSIDQLRVPLGKLPGVGLLLRYVAHSRYVPRLEAQQQRLDEIALEMLQMLADASRRQTALENALGDNVTALNNAMAAIQQSNAGLGTHVNALNGAIDQMQQSQASLGTHLTALGGAIEQLQQAHTDLGTHTETLDTALGALQTDHTALGGHVQHIDQVLTALDEQVNKTLEPTMQRMRAELTYLPNSLNEIFDELRAKALENPHPSTPSPVNG